MKGLVELTARIAFSPPRLIALPAFVSRREATVPAVRAAVVRLEDDSVAAFADAIRRQEMLDTIGFRRDPETLKMLGGDDYIRKLERRNAEQWDELRRTKVPLGTMVPAEVVCDDRPPVGCVVRLDRREAASGLTAFECTLFLAADLPLPSGTMLRRRSGHWPQEGQPRLLERVVGTVLHAGPAKPLSSTVPAPETVVASAREGKLELRCLSCGARHPAGRFDAEAMEVAELTTLWRRQWKELTLLRRAANLYKKHPAARGYVKPDIRSILDSKDPAIRKKLLNGLPFNQIKPPRPPDYETNVQRWLSNDPELRKFLESGSFNLEARLPEVEQSEQKHRARLRGRAVHCPACSDGLLALADADYPWHDD
jgi:hypothetical protein